MSTRRYGWPRPRFFQPGERVTLTRRALRLGLQGKARTPAARVVNCINGVRLIVVRDGLRRHEGWHTCHWRRVKAWSGGPTPGRGE